MSDSDLLKPVIELVNQTHFIFGCVTSDVSTADAIKRSRGDQGSSISWITGHLCSSRIQMLNVAGTTRENPFEETFGFASAASDGSDYPDFAEMRETWNGLHADVIGALGNVPESRLHEVASGGPPVGGRPVWQGLNTLCWHEAYHMGVLGALRASLGLPSTAELVIQKMMSQG